MSEQWRLVISDGSNTWHPTKWGGIDVGRIEALDMGSYVRRGVFNSKDEAIETAKQLSLGGEIVGVLIEKPEYSNGALVAGFDAPNLIFINGEKYEHKPSLWGYTEGDLVEWIAPPENADAPDWRGVHVVKDVQVNRGLLGVKNPMTGSSMTIYIKDPSSIRPYKPKE